MAVLPSPSLVAGQSYAVFEAWYNHVDPKNLGSISAFDAANFLKKSGLKSAILSKVWDLSDPYGKGYLDHNGFFIALKLVALAQNGLEVNMANVAVETPPPNMGEQPPVIVPADLPSTMSTLPSATSVGSFGSLGSPTSNIPKTHNWAVTPMDKTKYSALFDSLNPVDEKLPGFKVREVLMNSTLPVETLGKIWDLADIDHDGALDRHEFAVAMHLVYKVLDNYPLPVSLPIELMPGAGDELNSRKGSSLVGAVNVLPAAASTVKPAEKNTEPLSSALPWVVNETDRVKYEALFLQADQDKDGYVSGMEIKDVFLQSRLPQPVLAHIWNLCDIGQTGKLNAEQFALAMWLVQLKVMGREIPAMLAPEMVPPSLRPKEGSADELTHSAELELITKEIEGLVAEKRQLETQIAQKEADVKIKNGEVRNLQTELDTLTATLKQLEIQKREAQKRLDDLDTQRSTLEQDLRGVEHQIEEHEKQVRPAIEVRSFRAQAEEQEKTLRTQEAEVAAKKQELNDVRNEELQMEQQMQATRLQLDQLQVTLQDTQLQISQIKARVSVLQEHQHQMDEALEAYEKALAAQDASNLTDALLQTIHPATTDADLFISPTNDRAKLNGGANHFDDGAFRSDPFSSLNTGPAAAGPFSTTSSNGGPFDETDLFARGTRSASADAFGAKDPFGSAFGGAAKPSNDPFASAFGQPKSEPFDAFGSSKTNAGTDPFGSDPFTAVGASSSPAMRVESPTPALPPKKSKQPPPRPAPPKATGSAGTKGPQRPAPPMSAAKSPVHGGSGDPFAPLNDPFAAAGTSSSASKDPFGGSGFADFASFDTKLTSTSTDGGTFDTWGSAGLFGVSNTDHLNNNNSNNNNVNSSNKSSRYAELEFTEDPFKDVGFGDPFTSHLISADDPFAAPTSVATAANGGAQKKSVDSNFDPFSTEKDPFSSPPPFVHNNNTINTVSTDLDNAFGLMAWTDGGRSDPFGSPLAPRDSKVPVEWADEFRFSSPSTTKSSVAKTSKASSSSKSEKLSEEAQLAWAASESVRLEKERRHKADLQEKADLEMAIALSKSEMDGRSLSQNQDRLI